MSYCEDKALPHSVFLGRVVQSGEPAWLPEDRAKVLAFRAEKAQRCTRCGTADWEWDADQYAYEPVTTRCIGCHKLAVTREDVKDLSAQVILVPKEEAARLRRQPSKRPRGRRRR